MTPMAATAVAPGVVWPDEVDEVIGGDLTAALAYLTPAGGAVVTGVAPLGLRDRENGVLSFTTSLGFPKKLHRLVRDPAVALSFHAREHGSSTSPAFVLLQGRASVTLEPSRERLEALVPLAERAMGEVRRGLVWGWLLREYYEQRVCVDVTVERLTVWSNLSAAGRPDVYGTPPAAAPPGQGMPTQGTGPRIDVDGAARKLSSLPHRVLAYRGADGLPAAVPVALGGHDGAGLRLVTPGGLLPQGGRRAGLLAHRYHPELVGLSTRGFTGWLDVAGDVAMYAPHTSRGFVAPPHKELLLVSNGLLAKAGMRRARRTGLAERLKHAMASGSPEEKHVGPAAGARPQRHV